MIGSELTPSAQKEARQGERGFEAFNSFLEQSTWQFTRSAIYALEGVE